MASGSFNITTDNTYISGKVSWSSVADTVSNTSDVTVTMYLSRTNTGYSTFGSGTFNIVVNGTTVSDSGSYTITYNSNTVMVTGTVNNVAHTADGSKSITISWSGSLGSVFSVNGGSGTAVLDKIARESTLTGGMNWTAGNPVTFTISRADASFTHSIKVEVQSNGSTYVFLNGNNNVLNGIGTSGTWTPSATDMTTIFDYCNNDTTSWNQGTRITLSTFNSSGGLVGTNTWTGTVSSPVASTTTYTPNFNIGDTLTIPITRAISSLVHKVQVYVNNVLVHTSPTSTITTSYTWIPSAGEKTAMYNANTTAKTSSSRIDITTYFDSTTTDQIVRSATSKSGTATVTNSLPLFTTATYTDYNSATLAITSPSQGANTVYIIQNKSQLRAEVTSANQAAGQNSATITKYIATVNGESVTKLSPFTFPLQFNFDTITANANQNLVVTAYDSRGFTTGVTLVVNVVPWVSPIVNSTAIRDFGFLANTPLTLTGTISPCNVNGTNVNTLDAPNVTYKTRVKNGTYGAPTQFSGQVVTLPSYTGTTVNLTIPTTVAWDIEVIVTDKFGSTTKTLTVGTGVPIMFIDDNLKFVGIGRFPLNAALEVAGNIRLVGSTTGNAASTWLGFYESDGTTRIGWVGDGATGDSDISLKAEVGNAKVTAGTASLVVAKDGDITFNGDITPNLSWTNLTLINGATTFQTRTPRYMKTGNKVVIEGEITAGSFGNVTIATLPVGYRPPQLRIFKTAHNSSVSNDGCTVYAHTDGSIIVQAIANTTNSISLMGMSFYLS